MEGELTPAKLIPHILHTHQQNYFNKNKGEFLEKKALSPTAGAEELSLGLETEHCKPSQLLNPHNPPTGSDTPLEDSATDTAASPGL